MKLLGEFKDQYQNTAFKIYESRAECRKGQFRLHRHTLFEIALIKEGKGIYVTQHGSETIAPGDIFLFSANEYSSFRRLSCRTNSRTAKNLWTYS